MRPGAGTDRRIEYAVSDLPLPLSPTSARHSPTRTAKLTSSTTGSPPNPTERCETSSCSSATETQRMPQGHRDRRGEQPQRHRERRGQFGKAPQRHGEHGVTSGPCPNVNASALPVFLWPRRQKLSAFSVSLWPRHQKLSVLSVSLWPRPSKTLCALCVSVARILGVLCGCSISGQS